MARIRFPGVGDQTRRYPVPSGLNPYIVPIYPSQIDWRVRPSDEPPDQFEMRQEAISLIWDGNRFENDRVVAIRWGYGPETDTLVVSDGPVWRWGAE